MPNYNTARITNSLPARAGNEITAVVASIAVTVALITNDTVTMMRVPAGATILDAILASSGSIGSTASLSLGDAATPARFISSTAYTGAVMTRLNVAAGVGFLYTVETPIIVTAVSMASGTTNATLTLQLLYTMQQA
jgi:hypothetical protein